MSRVGWTGWLLRRWPTALALAMTALTFDSGDNPDAGGNVDGLGEALPVASLLYPIVAKLRRPKASWPVLVVGLTAMILLRVLDVAAPVTVFTAIALLVLVWGAVDGQLHRPGTFRIQALGMACFVAVALAGLAVDPDLGRYLVAAGWMFHGVWDFIHLRLNKVVVRSYAEWCGVVDVLIAVQLLLLG